MNGEGLSYENPGFYFYIPKWQVVQKHLNNTKLLSLLKFRKIIFLITALLKK